MHYKRQSGQFLVTEKSARHNTVAFRQRVPADRVFAYDNPHRPTTCYHDFAPSSASAPFLSWFVCMEQTTRRHSRGTWHH